MKNPFIKDKEVEVVMMPQQDNTMEIVKNVFAIIGMFVVYEAAIRQVVKNVGRV